MPNDYKNTQRWETCPWQQGPLYQHLGLFSDYTARNFLAYLITWSQFIQRGHLSTWHSFTEQIHRWQLTAEHVISVTLITSTDKTLVKWLESEKKFCNYATGKHSFSYQRWSPIKQICIFEHSVMTNFNCPCPVIQRGQGSGFLSEGSSWLTACMSEQWRFWRDCADVQARLNLRCSHRR